MKKSKQSHMEASAEAKSQGEQSGKKRRVVRRVWRIMLVLLIAGILGYAGLVGFVYYAETHVPDYRGADFDSIIVLGAQVLPDGEPSIQLRWRLDKAAEVYWERMSRPCPAGSCGGSVSAEPCDACTHFAIPMVLCGGQAGSEPAPEGDVMRAILIAEGLPEAHLYAESTSTDTRENIRLAWEILSELGCEKPLLVTSDYHLPRALAIAGDLELSPLGAGSLCRDGIEFWLKNHMREALAWVKYWGIKYVGLPL